LAAESSYQAAYVAWEGILAHQLDNRFRPCNFVELIPLLQEHLRR
jgi:molybdenum cofactor biosynthesis protein B